MKTIAVSAAKYSLAICVGLIALIVAFAIAEGGFRKLTEDPKAAILSFTTSLAIALIAGSKSLRYLLKRPLRQSRLFVLGALVAGLSTSFLLTSYLGFFEWVGWWILEDLVVQNGNTDDVQNSMTFRLEKPRWQKSGYQLSFRSERGRYAISEYKVRSDYRSFSTVKVNRWFAQKTALLVVFGSTYQDSGDETGLEEGVLYDFRSGEVIRCGSNYLPIRTVEPRKVAVIGCNELELFANRRYSLSDQQMR